MNPNVLFTRHWKEAVSSYRVWLQYELPAKANWDGCHNKKMHHYTFGKQIHTAGESSWPLVDQAMITCADSLNYGHLQKQFTARGNDSVLGAMLGIASWFHQHNLSSVSESSPERSYTRDHSKALMWLPSVTTVQWLDTADKWGVEILLLRINCMAVVMCAVHPARQTQLMQARLT